jgi:hypothetical protein
MARKRYFSEIDKTALLEAIGECRKACIGARALAPVNGDVCRGVDGVNQAIDQLAGLLTDDPEYFHLKIAPSRSLEVSRAHSEETGDR